MAMDSAGLLLRRQGPTGTPGGLRGQHMADVASAEFRIALRPASPLLPNDGTKPPPHPLVKASKRGWCFAEAEVAVPSIEVDGKVFDSTFEAHPPCAACQFPNPPLEPDDRVRRDAPLRLFTGCEAEAQECTLPRTRDRALRRVDLELELGFQEPGHAVHHAPPCSVAANIDVAVIGITHEAMAPVLEFPVQLIKHKVRQQRRQRATLRRALIRRVDQPVFHHPRGQIAADKLEQPLVGHPFRHQAHQHCRD